MDDLALQSAVELNAVVTVDAEGALRRADELDAEREAARIRGPLHGVPMAVKDAFATAGIRAASGKPRAGRRCPRRGRRRRRPAGGRRRRHPPQDEHA